MMSLKNHVLYLLAVVFVPLCLRAHVSVPTLETERCIIRLVTLDDAEGLFPLVSSEHVAKYTFVFSSLHRTPEETYHAIEACLRGYLKGTSITLVIVEKNSNNIVGLVMIYGYSEAYRKAEVAGYLLPEYWAQGIATEAMQAIMMFAFKNLKLVRLQATADPRNEGSIRVIKKCGMFFEGLLRNYYIVNGEPCDRNMYSMTDEEFHHMNR